MRVALVTYFSEMMDGAALMSPFWVSSSSMAFSSSRRLYRATMLDSERLSRIRIFRMKPSLILLNL